MKWTIIYLPEANQELKRLDQSVRPQILKGIRKVAQDPTYPDGYGKPLGTIAGCDLSGLFKIKFRKIGLRVVYGLTMEKEQMTIVIISARADNKVYKEASKRRKKYGL